MAGEAADLLADLPAWAKAAISAGLFVSTLVGGLYVGQRAKAAEKAKETAPEHEGFDAEELMETTGIKGFLKAVDEVATNTRIIAEKAGVLAAAHVALAKVIEEDFNEKRVNEAIEKRAQELAERRAAAGNAQPSHGWGGGPAHP